MDRLTKLAVRNPLKGWSFSLSLAISFSLARRALRHYPHHQPQPPPICSTFPSRWPQTAHTASTLAIPAPSVSHHPSATSAGTALSSSPLCCQTLLLIDLRSIFPCTQPVIGPHASSSGNHISATEVRFVCSLNTRDLCFGSFSSPRHARLLVFQAKGARPQHPESQS
jgi:hypothetical protein